MRLLQPGTVLLATTGTVEETTSTEPAVDLKLDLGRRLQVQQPRRAAPRQPRNRHTLGHTLQYGLLGKESFSTKLRGPRLGLVSLSFPMNQKSSIEQQSRRAWLSFHKSHMKLPPIDLSRSLRLQRDHLLLIFWQTWLRPWLMTQPTSMARQALEAVQ